MVWIKLQQKDRLPNFLLNQSNKEEKKDNKDRKAGIWCRATVTAEGRAIPAGQGMVRRHHE